MLIRERATRRSTGPPSCSEAIGCHYPAFGVTLRQNQREWYYSKLDEHFPGLRHKYAKQFGNAYECNSPRANELWRAFKAECDKFGIVYRMEEIIEAYREPYRSAQLSLF